MAPAVVAGVPVAVAACAPVVVPAGACCDLSVLFDSGATAAICLLLAPVVVPVAVAGESAKTGNICVNETVEQSARTTALPFPGVKFTDLTSSSFIRGADSVRLF